MGHVLYHFLYRQVVFLLTCDEEDKLVHGEEFKREGKIASVAEDGHLEDLEEAYIGNDIIPFGQGVIIPHFPQEAAP